MEGKLISILLCVFAVLIPCVVCAWVANANLPQVKWTETGNIKWSQEQSVYEAYKIDEPDKGFYRSADDFTMPKSWPESTQKRFALLSKGMTDELREKVTKWTKPSLQANTKWIDAKADKNIGYIEILIPEYSHFTFVMLDPEEGIIDQDFKGTARIYGLRDDKPYRIYAFDGNGTLGEHVTAVSDKYIHTLIQYPDDLGAGRTPVMAQRVVEDPNKDLWVTTYSPIGAGAAYQFVDVYSLNAEGNFRSKFRVPLTTSYLKTWETSLLLEENGDAVITAAETPNATYQGPAFVARVDRSGQTVWQTPLDQTESAMAIVKTGSGYVYVGSNWDGQQDYACLSGITEQIGNLSKLTFDGAVTIWGSTGVSNISTGYAYRGAIYSPSTAGVTVSTYTDLIAAIGGVSSSTFESGNTSDCFDGSVTTGVSDTVIPVVDETVTWDFGVGNGQRVIYMKAYVEEDRAMGLVSWYMEHSADAVSWVSFYATALTPGTAAGWITGVTDVTDRYWRVRANGPMLAGQIGLYEFDLLGYNNESATATLLTACGHRNELGPELTTLYSASNISGVWPGGTADEVFDNSLSTYVSEGCVGACEAYIEIIFTQDVYPTHVKLWEEDTFGPTENPTLQYWDGAAWQDVGAVPCGMPGVLDFDVGAWDRWRLYWASLDADAIYEFQMYDKKPRKPAVVQYYLVDQNSTIDGTQRWATEFPGVSGYFTAMARSGRTGDYYVSGTSNQPETLILSSGKGLVACVTESGTSRWIKEYPQVSAFYDIAAAEDGGFFLSGTLYSGTSVQARQAVVMKIDSNGNVDTKFPQTFKETQALASDGRGVIETRDGGALMVGGSSDVANTSKPYLIKLDRFYRSCSQGDVCE